MLTFSPYKFVIKTFDGLLLKFKNNVGLSSIFALGLKNENGNKLICEVFGNGLGTVVWINEY